MIDGIVIDVAVNPAKVVAPVTPSVELNVPVVAESPAKVVAPVTPSVELNVPVVAESPAKVVAPVTPSVELNVPVVCVAEPPEIPPVLVIKPVTPSVELKVAAPVTPSVELNVPVVAESPAMVVAPVTPNVLENVPVVNEPELPEIGVPEMLPPVTCAFAVTKLVAVTFPVVASIVDDPTVNPLRTSKFLLAMVPYSPGYHVKLYSSDYYLNLASCTSKVA